MSGSTLSFLDIFGFLWSSNSVVVRLCVHHSFVKRHNNRQTRKKFSTAELHMVYIKAAKNVQLLRDHIAAEPFEESCTILETYVGWSFAGSFKIHINDILLRNCWYRRDCRGGQGMLGPPVIQIHNSNAAMQALKSVFCGLGLLFVCHVCQLLQC